MNIHEMEPYFRQQITDEKVLSSQLDALKYIKHLADVSATKIGDWDILSIFRSPILDGRICVDKPAINKRFFSHRDEVSPCYSVAEQLKPYEKTIRSINDEFNATNSKAHELIKQYDNARSTVRSCALALAVAQQEEAHAFRAARVAKLRPPVNYGKAIADFVSMTEVEIESISLDHVTFKLPSPICLAYAKEDGTYLQANLGRFALTINLQDLYVMAHGRGDNVDISGHIHPHVDSNGALCWGKHKFEYRDALGSRNLWKVLDLAFMILHGYAPALPYVQLWEFEKAKRLGVNPYWVPGSAGEDVAVYNGRDGKMLYWETDDEYEQPCEEEEEEEPDFDEDDERVADELREQFAATQEAIAQRQSTGEQPLTATEVVNQGGDR